MEKKTQETRRAFVTRAGRAVVAAPAAALLLNATAEKAKAISVAYEAPLPLD